MAKERQSKRESSPKDIEENAKNEIEQNDESTYLLSKAHSLVKQAYEASKASQSAAIDNTQSSQTSQLW